MRTSRTASEIDKIDKVVYPKCNLKKQHQKQSLNLVCLTKTCKLQGPICSLCKKQHAGHNVVPIRMFLSSIAQANKKLSINDSKIQQKAQFIGQEKLPIKSTLQRLEQSYYQIMGMLNYQVIELSQQIKKTQAKLVEQFQQAKLALLQQNNKGEIIEECLNFLGKKEFEDVLQYRKNIHKILKYTNCNKNQAQIKFLQQDIAKAYEEKAQLYKDNIFFIQNQIKELYLSINQKLVPEKNQIMRPKTAMPGTSKIQNICFSPTLKGGSIVLQKDGKSAKLNTNGSKVVFFNNVISTKIYQTTVKIVSLLGNISFGVALKDKIKQKAYKFQKGIGGHGAYLIVSNTFKYNHSEKAEDGVNTSFGFGVGDQIQMTLKVKQKKLIFTVKDESKRIAQLSLKSLPDSSFKQLQFCAVFAQIGDKVQIL